jgi:GTP-binding protein Era
MNRAARASVEGVDLVLLVLDASVAPREEDEGWMRRLMRETVPCFAVLNKVDKGAKAAGAYEALWKKTAVELKPDRTTRWFWVSALKQEGLPELVDALFAAMPEGPRLFPENVLTDFPRKLAIADVIREKLFRGLRQELPHSVAVFVDAIEEDQERWNVQATVYVQKATQKGIVIGEKGRALRAVRRSAERELSEIYEKDVSVRLWVKVEKNWQRNFWFLKKLGYVG